MTELVIQPRGSIKIKIGEEVYDVRKPSNKHLKEFQASSKEDGAALDLIVSTLAALGLPESVTWDLDPASLEAIIEALVPKKKA